MIDELIENSEIFDLLGLEDSRVITKAKRILSDPPLSSYKEEDAIVKIWYKDNIDTQANLSNLKSRIDYVKNQKYWELKRLEGQTLKEDDIIVDIKNREERICYMVASDNTIKDHHITVGNLEVLSKYVESLLWGLRNSLTLFKG